MNIQAEQLILEVSRIKKESVCIYSCNQNDSSSFDRVVGQLRAHSETDIRLIVPSVNQTAPVEMKRVE